MNDFKELYMDLAADLEAIERNVDALRAFQTMIIDADPGTRAVLEAITDALSNHITDAGINAANLREALQK